MKAIVCDKCKNVFMSEKALKDMLRLDLCNNFSNKFDEKHLCDDCGSKFYSWLKSE